MPPRRVRIVRPRDAADELVGEDVDAIGEIDTERHYTFVEDNPDPISIEDSILRDFGLSHTDPHGRGKLGGHYSADPYARWGNKENIPLSPPGGPSVFNVKEFLVAELATPAEMSVRLSATSDAAPLAGFVITWKLLIGVGSAMQARQWSVPVTNTIGPPSDDVMEKFPVKVLRVAAVVAFPAGGLRAVVVAHASPTFPQLPQGVR
jgi:hypothetical protein